MNKIIFNIDRGELLNALKQMKKLTKAKLKKDVSLEVTVYTGHILLVSPGIQLKCRGRSTGPAKFTTWLAYFCDIIEPGTEPEVQFTLTDGELRLRCLMVKVPTTFFENDRILRSIDLPVNYGFTDLVRLHLSNRYTREEIEFNNLESEVSGSNEQIE